jgi:predicted ATPase
VIERVKITGFRALANVEVPLRPLTVLIGSNDTGKSSFLQALWLVNGGGTTIPLDYSFNNIRNPFRIEQEAEGLGLTSLDGRGGKQPQLSGTDSGPFPRPAIFLLPTQGASMTSQGAGEDPSELFLNSDGSGVPSLLDHFLRRDRRRFLAVVEAVKLRVPGVEDLQIGTPSAAERRLDLALTNGFVMPADQASAGVRLLLFFLALAYHPNPPELILIEEPETGLHPRRLADVMKLLKEITKGVHGGRAAQVVLTTHSPYLLDHVDLDEDQVLVFKRDDDGTRTAKPIDREGLDDYLGEFLLGELWFNKGEEGLVAR